MYSPLHYGSESKAPADGDWERETVSEKLPTAVESTGGERWTEGISCYSTGDVGGGDGGDNSFSGPRKHKLKRV